MGTKDPNDVVYRRVAGMDVSKSDVKVCVRVPSTQRNRYHSEVTTWGATVPEIMKLKAFLEEAQLELVVMESTSDYWKPYFYLLEDTVPVQLVNARQARNLPGRKTDVSDAHWLAKTASWGMLAPSFVPPPPIRVLRDLTRARSTITFGRASELQRLEKYLESTGSKLSSVVSDLDGVTSTLILRALAGGERDPKALAALAKGRLKNKTDELEQALTGIRFTAHDAFMVAFHLDELNAQQARLAALDAQITEAFAPFRTDIELLSTIPGVKTTIAQVIIAETGGNMAAFPTSAQLASWAGVAPGNNESAGRHKPAATSKGDKYLKAALGQAALNIAKQKGGFLPTRYKRIANRRGKPRAIVATGHTLITDIWNMLANGVAYEEPHPRRYDQANNDRTRQHALRALKQLGYEVTLTQAA
ncbi:IS110 family RNA-guided transposase [Arthrobacter dokdonensis]|jgi:transposase|uniref:IS110 family transposase n=1 Tax=Arthrobacter dokdonellae TaxID=2211210 RepID=UPI000DE5A885|nr:IS110 family transposase [Arthrobacter dokdonellae]